VFFRWKTESAEDAELTPEEREQYSRAVDRVREDQLRALRDPGPTWREWWYYDGMKWWVGLLYLILDSWIGVGWIDWAGYVAWGTAGLFVSLAGALYLEILFYRYLWRRPQEEASQTGPFRPGWTALREFGRWTPEEAAVRAGKIRRAPTDGSTDAHEFL
jgi:hypothetical protein